MIVLNGKTGILRSEFLKAAKAVNNEEILKIKNENEINKIGNKELWNKYYQSLDDRFLIRTNKNIKSAVQHNEIYINPDREKNEIEKIIKLRMDTFNKIKKRILLTGENEEDMNVCMDLEIELSYLKERFGNLKQSQNLDEVYINHTEFLNIINTYYKLAADKIIEGDVFKLGKLGLLRILKVDRNKKRKTVNFAETDKLKKQGENKIVYFLDDYYFLITLEKFRYINFVNFYKFKASKNNNHDKENSLNCFLNKFKKALKEHKEYQLRYKHIINNQI